MASNPKTLLFFGAFIPQFVDPAGKYVTQVISLGLIAMVIACLSDGAYAVVTGRTGSMLSRGRIRTINRISGLFMISGGAWLAFLSSDIPGVSADGGGSSSPYAKYSETCWMVMRKVVDHIFWPTEAM